MPDHAHAEVYLHSTDLVTSPWHYCVVAGGRTRVSGRDGTVSRQYHDHTLILTLSGHGSVRVGQTKFTASPGSLSWLDTSRTYQHGANPKSVWSYLWVAFSGYGLDKLHSLIDLVANPVLDDMGGLEPCFDDILQILIDRPQNADALLNAQIAQMASVIYTKRMAATAGSDADPVTRVMRRLRRDIARNWDIATLSEIAGLSSSQLFRRFKAITGTSPKKWLRQERMLLARHLLLATQSDIAVVALRCGYPDPFHFSRDFKHENGCSPRLYRANMRVT